MDQRDYSGYYQSGQPSASSYGSTINSSQTGSHTSSPTSDPQYGHSSPAQITYHNDRYDLAATTGYYPAEEDPSRAGRRQSGSRSVSSGPSSSNTTSARRREQNRLAQRALRQRRESHIRELEHRILHTSLETRHLAVENRELSQQLHSVTTQNQALRHEQVDSSRSAAAWAQQQYAGAAAYSSYAPQTQISGACSDGYNESAAYYQHSPLSVTNTPRPASEPTRTVGAEWTWDESLDPTLYDPSYAWAGDQNPQTTQQMTRQYYRDEEEEEDEE